MVKAKAETMSAAAWLAHVKGLRGEVAAKQLEKALTVYSDDARELALKAVAIGDVLLQLDLNTETLQAALLYPYIQAEPDVLEDMGELFSESQRKLLTDILQLQALDSLEQHRPQSEKIRKMLLAMVSDAQAILITLAERIWQLRQAKQASRDTQLALAEKTQEIYAPLANRLGVWQLKWELEDLSFRYRQPDAYKTISESLTMRRTEREAYIDNTKQIILDLLHQADLKNVTITGRAKHIYSIYHKMQRKGAAFEAIYDISAFRIFVDTNEECFHVLSLLHNQWVQVPEEFDDYITKPKPNGYQSIHTVLLGPDDHYIEVQIRTHSMHQASELGVASHWRYKEGGDAADDYEAKIALLRQILEWNKDISHNKPQTMQDLFADRVYVFTPLGDIIDLPQGSTPLDFAYHIHSEIGHRCRGAKANGKIVPLTYPLKTGDRVEIITAKFANPSRDWLNPQAGYLHSPRARSRLAHYFRLKDALPTKEVKSVEHKAPAPHKLMGKVGEGTHVFNEKDVSLVKPTASSMNVDSLLTKLAKCCKPLPGDSVLGYVTKGAGVSIHRNDCKNVKNMLKGHEDRVIDINFAKAVTSSYPIDLRIIATDRAGLLRDITGTVTAAEVKMAGLRTHENPGETEAHIYLTLVVNSVAEMDKIISLLKQIPSVNDVRRL